ncbi:type II secretion system F family protein [Plastoroseomonas hellenica]|uniref:type II secretion system F family protein n=1 Tax=Plastoroseomonas hellenica TaxID=2687306 RepID=UPI001BA6F14B|nr:type II secretion system F family protein [Plastoroseomonas hellenica]MBR0642114.1 type II secretion system protein F [Plastoroseomonas hellenica]
MSGSSRGMLLAAGIGCVLLMVFCIWALNAITRQDKVAARIAVAVGRQPGKVRHILPVGTITQLAPSRKTLAQATTSFFGVDLRRSDEYPMRWWLVILVMLPLARAMAGLAALLTDDLLVLATPAVWVMLSRSFFGWAEERRRHILFRQFPDALAMIVRAVRVGIPITGAIAAAARESPQPTAREFQAITDRLAIGMQLQEALNETAMRNGVTEYRFFATALSLQARTGGSPTEALENLADVIRRRVALQERGRALASQARASAIVLVGLPIVIALLLTVINFDYISLLFTDPTGRSILATAIVLLSIGMYTMRVMIRKSLS